MSLVLSNTEAAERLRHWLARYERIFVLTGAGCSTASGIPDYRSPDKAWKRRPPVDFRDYVSDPLMRARYWARSFVGWPLISAALPNPAHAALADWQRGGRLSRLVSQNVDGLHQKAGSRDVIDLHGRIDAVICLDCARSYGRAEIQRRLRDENPDWVGLNATTAPDGDADLEHLDFSKFHTPRCEDCGGMLKPDVVFFGENVPRMRYQAARVALEAADALLVVGSSLMVYSGFRFVRWAHETGCPVAILNRGQTRADDTDVLKLDADCTGVLPLALQWADIVSEPRRSPPHPDPAPECAHRRPGPA